MQYEKAAGQHGWFGPGFDKIAAELDIAQILAYDEADERILVGRSKDAKPSYYMVFVTAYKDGIIPERLQGRIARATRSGNSRRDGKEDGIREGRRHETGAP